MPCVKRLIVNADDFGLHRAINAGVLRAHQHGIVTSTSLMVRQDAATDAVERARSYPRLAIGLHLDLGEWVYADGAWTPTYEVVRLDDPVAVQKEVDNQLQAFRALLGRNPTHIDSHQHVHLREPVRSAARRLASGLGVPLRGEEPRIHYLGKFYGQTETGEPLPAAITVDAMCDQLSQLAPGVTELTCHPAEFETTEAPSEMKYWEERVAELETLCDPRVRESIRSNDIDLCPFSHFLSTPLLAGRVDTLVLKQ